MVRHENLFSQLIALFDRKIFYELVYRHQSERYAKRFGSLGHFISMLFQVVQPKASERSVAVWHVAWAN